MAPHAHFLPRRHGRYRRTRLEEMLRVFPGLSQHSRRQLSGQIFRLLPSHAFVRHLANGSDQAMINIVALILEGPGQFFHLGLGFDPQLESFDDWYARTKAAFLVIVRDYHNRLFVRRGLSEQQQPQQPQPQQPHTSQLDPAQQAEAELLLDFSTHAHRSLPQQDEEGEDDNDEDMMAPVGFAFSGLAARTTTPTPAPPATTVALAFRPAPGAEEDRIE